MKRIFGAITKACCLLMWGPVAMHCSTGSPKNAPVKAVIDKPLPKNLDPFVQKSRLKGSTFIEVAEVKAQKDGLLYFCTGVQGLRIVDATNPEQMKALSTVRSILSHSKFARCQHLALGDKHVFVTNKGDEIQPTPFVSMVSLGDSPKEVSVFTKQGHTFEGIDAEGSDVYVAMHGKGVMRLKQNQDTLSEVTTLKDGLKNAWAVDVVGDLLYVADGENGLVIYDVSKKNAPTALGHIALEGVSQGLQVIDNVAFIAAGSAGLIAVDVSTPSQPQHLATHDTPGIALQVSIAGDIAYVADWSSVQLIDVKTPKAPRPFQSEHIKTQKKFSRVLGVSAQGGNVFVGEWTGMYAFQSDPNQKAPDLTVSQSELNFGKAVPGTPKMLTLTLNNNGTDTWMTTDFKVSENFSTTQTQLNLEPGEQKNIEITFNSTKEDEVKGSIEIHSNDPDEPVKRVLLRANPKGLGVGNKAKNVALRLLEGGVWESSAKRNKIIVLSYFATF